VCLLLRVCEVLHFLQAPLAHALRLVPRTPALLQVTMWCGVGATTLMANLDQVRIPHFQMAKRIRQCKLLRYLADALHDKSLPAIDMCACWPATARCGVGATMASGS
jgi:hypothetical protein